MAHWPGLLNVMANPVPSYPHFEPKLDRIGILDLPQRHPNEVVVEKTDKIKDGDVVVFGVLEMLGQQRVQPLVGSYHQERFLVVGVKQLQDGTVLEIPSLARKHYRPMPGSYLGKIPGDEQLCKQLLEFIGPLLMEYVVPLCRQVPQALEDQMQELATTLLRDAWSRGNPEFQGATLQVISHGRHAHQLLISLRGKFHPRPWDPPLIVTWGGSISLGDPGRVPSPPPPEPLLKPSPFVDHKPYWKLPS